MKYMGSKDKMLQNGLGDLLLHQVTFSNRFVDLFTGAGHVACFIAEKTSKPVFAIDLQKYSTILAYSVIGRNYEVNSEQIIDGWISRAIVERDKSSFWKESKHIKASNISIRNWVLKSRELCKKNLDIGICWNSYGGYYFSPDQALTFDFLIKNLPENEPFRSVCLASLISAAMECVASPGHTAQPFQPTVSAGPYLFEAWNRNPVKYCLKAINTICSRHAQVIGRVLTSNAIDAVDELNRDDLVFIDPPYSNVQYSRFYHVLETIARGEKPTEITGAGRYPPLTERPQSSFSNISQSKIALENLLKRLSLKGCKVIFTFPRGSASNGLSGDIITNTAEMWFKVEDHSVVEGKFSTLGGNNTKRDARKNSSELVLLLFPKLNTKENIA